jgi:lysophospholipase L1-like esterase
VLNNVFTPIGLPGISRALRARGMRIANNIGAAARAFAIGAALVGATVYGYSIHRNHVFPYRLFNPDSISAPGQSPVFRARYSMLATFPARADLVMLGDSLTEIADWHAILPDVDVANHGISGDATAGLLLRLDLVRQARPRIDAIMIGVNDIQDGDPVVSVFDRYRQIVETLAILPACVLTQSTLFTARGAALNASIADLDRRLAAFCAAGNCTFLDVNAAIAPRGMLPPEATIDGVHLTGAAYEKWRSVLRPHLAADECGSKG